MLGWFLYLLFIPEIVSFSRERVLEEELCLFAVFKVGMFIKEQDFIIFSKSNFRTYVDLILNFGFIIFRKTLLSVTLHMSGLPKRHPSLNSQSYYFRNKVKKNTNNVILTTTIIMATATILMILKIMVAIIMKLIKT